MLTQFKGSIKTILRSSVYRAEIDYEVIPFQEHYKIWYNEDGTFRLEIWNIDYTDYWTERFMHWKHLVNHLPVLLQQSDDWRFYAYYPY